jgi:dTMP kinase
MFSIYIFRKEAHMPGKMIVIDGNDGSGKQTQTEMLRSYLLKAEKKVLPLSFPRYQDTFFGRELKKALAGDYGDFLHLDPHLAALLYIADRWSSKALIKSALETDSYVICDRYASSNQIHQGGKITDESKREDFLAWLEQLEYGEFNIHRPDISVYLDVPPAVSQKLMSDKTRDIVEDNPEYLENSHQSAQWLIAREPNKWIHVLCTRRGLMRSREDIHEEIIARLMGKGFI